MTHMKWKFPTKRIFYFKGESFLVAVLSFLVFLLGFSSFEEPWIYGLTMVVIFVSLYLIIGQIVHYIRQVEESYHVTKTHFHASRKTRWSHKREKVAFKDIKHHKFDKFFLAGYMVSKSGRRHSLFFNNLKDLEKFEKKLKK